MLLGPEPTSQKIMLIVRRVGAVADDQPKCAFLFEDRFAVAAGPQNKWLGRRKLELRELVNEPWVLPSPESAIGSVAVEIFRMCGLHFARTTVTVGLPSIRAKLLMTGRFLTIFPSCIWKFPVTQPEMKALPVQLPIARVPDAIVILKSRTLSPITELFIAHAREVAKLLPKEKRRAAEGEQICELD